MIPFGKAEAYNRLEVKEAYAKALRTWAQRIDSDLGSNRTRIFFRGHSASHFRKMQWNTGGSCDGETWPITNNANITPYAWMMRIMEYVIAEMKTQVFYLNIAKMTDNGQDGHPSRYRQREIQRSPGTFQDCGHWCLPGVPDSSIE